MPLAEAVAVLPSQRDHVELPAVYTLYRVPNAKDAALEEGIFRLSGSNM